MAINFPSTAGQPTDGSFTYTDSTTGLLYFWDGSSWSSFGTPAAGGGGYADFDVDIHLNTTSANSGEILSWNGSDYDWVADQTGGGGGPGGGVTDVDSLTDVSITNIQDGHILLWNSSSSEWINSTNVATQISSINGAYFGVGDPGTGNPAIIQIEGLGAGGTLELTNGGSPVAISFDFNSGLAGQVITATGVDANTGQATGATWATPSTISGRQTANAQTQSIADGVSDDIVISAAKSYGLITIETSAAAWVTLYTDTASRTADASRTENTDALPGTGVIAEVITAGAATQLMTPGVFGFNNDTTPSANVYAKVVNKSGSAAAITVTLTYTILEV